jgi:hypothetical protein
MHINIETCLRNLDGVLNKIGVKYLLRNGHIEKPLKFLMASFLELNPDYAYVMDKKFEAHEIDLLAFERGAPRFAAEFKCTFSSTSPSVLERIAKNAFEKSLKTKELKEITIPKNHIVHFLNYAKHEKNEVPDFVFKKYSRHDLIKLEDVIDCYRRCNRDFIIEPYYYKLDNSIDRLEAVLVTWPE